MGNKHLGSCSWETNGKRRPLCVPWFLDSWGLSQSQICARHRERWRRRREPTREKHVKMVSKDGFIAICGKKKHHPFWIPIENLSIILRDFPDYIQNCSCKSQNFCHLHQKPPKNPSTFAPDPTWSSSGRCCLMRWIWGPIWFSSPNITSASSRTKVFTYQPLMIFFFARSWKKRGVFFYVENEPVEALGCYKELQAATFWSVVMSG